MVEPESSPWTVIDLVFLLTIVLGSLFLAEILEAIILTVYSATGHGQFAPREVLTMMNGDARCLLPIQLVSDAIVVGFVFLTAHVKYKLSMASAIQWRPLEGSMIGMFLLSGVTLAILSQLIPALFPTDKVFPIEKLFKDPQSGYLLAVFGIAIAPFFEELIFRGMIYPVIERHWGLEAGVLLSALMFAGIHAPQLDGGLPQLGAIFFVGVALGYARGRTKSLMPSFLMHTSYNATLFTAIFIATKGFHVRNY